MAKITMSLRTESKFLGKDFTKVTFGEVPEPVTGDDLAGLFYRFAVACGYSERTMGESMVGIGSDLLPPEKTYDDSEDSE